MGRPTSVFFNNSKISENQTSIADIIQDSYDFLNEQSFDTESVSDILNNEKKENKKVAFQISTANFNIIDNRIKGIVNISSTQKTNEEYTLHLKFSPLDLKQNVFGEKKNELHFKSDLTESIQINESSKNFKNVSIEIHIMKNDKIIGQKTFIEVLESDTQDFPESTKKTDYTKYAVIGIGLVGLIILYKKMRGKNKT
jgi:hypothetical protein